MLDIINTVYDSVLHKLVCDKPLEVNVNKWQIICPLTLFAVIGVLAVRSNVEEDNRISTSAISQLLDGHSSNIAALLDAMHTNDSVQIEDAVYQELQRPFSTTLITRSQIHVTRTANGILECTVDAVPPRTIRQVRPNYPVSSKAAPP